MKQTYRMLKCLIFVVFVLAVSICGIIFAPGAQKLPAVFVAVLGLPLFTMFSFCYIRIEQDLIVLKVIPNKLFIKGKNITIKAMSIPIQDIAWIAIREKDVVFISIRGKDVLEFSTIWFIHRKKLLAELIKIQERISQEKSIAIDN